MKKAITILAVLIVLVGAVFATTTETHKIKIKADVTIVPPIFQLGLNVGEKTNDGEVAFSSATYYDQTGYDVGFNLDEAGTHTVTAYAYLANLAKPVANTVYTLHFSDGVFTVSRTADPQNTTLSPVIATSKGANATGFTTAREEGEGNVDVTVTFNGTTVTAADAVLATATYTYTGDPTIDPLAQDQYYYADVKLEISTT